MGYMIRGTASNGSVRFFAAITTDIVEEARKIHNLAPTSSAAFGRLLTAGTIMGSMLKSTGDRLTLTMNGGGIAGNLVVASDYTGNVKGYMSNPSADLPPNDKGKLDVGGIVGREGMLTVIKDEGLKEPYVGKVPIKTGEIGDDLAYYFTKSEQVPSAVAVGVLVNKDISIKAAGGFIIQMMPDADPFVADIITYRLQEIPPLTQMIDEGKNAEDIINTIFEDMDPNILEKKQISYLCDCSRERIENVLLALGKNELKKLSEEQETTEVQCHFCNKKYKFSREDIRNLIEK